MPREEFFNEAKEQSEVKAAIVSTYFKQWFTAIKNTARRHDSRVGYIDLFAGPGRYDDGTVSTPLLILKQAIADAELRDMLVTVFNDREPEFAASLTGEIKKLKGIKTLKFVPEILNEEIDANTVKEFEGMNFIPTLFFIDPWGYKGLSLGLINAVLKDWACECIFFFNYNRISMGLPNTIVDQHMNALFGRERADALRGKLVGLSASQRELAIVEELCEALHDMGGKYILPFRFRRPDGMRTSHHLIFVSKHPLGYKIMKGVMAAMSSGEEQGVPTFEYNQSFGTQGFLFELALPLDDLEEMLLEAFAGQTLTFEEIYEQHNYGRRYVERNYRSVLNSLDAQGKIDCDPPAEKRRMYLGERSFAKYVEVTFPKRRRRRGTIKH